MPEKELSDLDIKALDALESAGFGTMDYYTKLQMLGKYGAIALLAAEEQLRAAEQEKELSSPKKYFQGILSRITGEKSAGHKNGSANKFKDPPWIVPPDLRRRQHIEQCQGCVRAAEMMPSYLEAIQKLATEDATRLPGAPHDETLGRLVDDWREAIDKEISLFKGEAYPRSDLADRARKFKPGTERFVVEEPHKGTALSESAFEAKRQTLRRRAAALIPMPVTLKAPSTPDVQEFDPDVDDGTPF